MKNAEFDHETEKISWSKEDTAFLDYLIKTESKSIPTSFKEIKAMHESIPY